MSQDLHATHQILAILEQSKSVADRILDNLPGMYITVDAAGNILRANIETSQYLNETHEDVLGIHVSRLFRHETWKLFEAKLLEVTQQVSKSVEFELVVDGGIEPKAFFWRIDQLNLMASDKGIRILYSIVARDISDLKRALNQVFSLGKNLELARAVQALLLPSQSQYRSKNLALTAYYEPAEVAGGDWWYFQPRSENEAIIMLGDVTGHGAGSAMVTSLVSGAVHALMEGEAKHQKDMNTQPIFHSINNSLLSLEGQPYWMTMFSMEISFEKRELTWRNAAAPPVYHLKKNGDLEIYQDVSRPLGAGELSITTGVEKIEPGERILMFTDGVFEMEGVAGSQLGQLPLLKTFMRTKDLAIEQARSLIEKKLNEWRGAKQLKDDAAFILLDLFPGA